MSLENLKNMIIEIKNLFLDKNSLYYTNKVELQNIIEIKYKDEIERYSSISNLLFGNKLSSDSFSRLEYMLSMAEKIENKDIVEHDASVAVGQRLVDDIVKPQLKK
jgi:hypothetical protein